MSEKPKKAIKEETASPPSVIWYESRQPEPSMFEVDGVRPIRNFSNGHLEWEVPAERDALFSQHFFVQTARVVKKRV
jgi:hypothetical protein